MACKNEDNTNPDKNASLIGKLCKMNKAKGTFTSEHGWKYHIFPGSTPGSTHPGVQGPRGTGIQVL